MLPVVNYSRVTDDELNLLVVGAAPQHSVPWTMRDTPTRLGSNEFGVVWVATRSEISIAQPLVIIVRKEDQRRLFGRFSQLRSDLSPLSAWCHITTPDRIDSVDDLVRPADLGDYTAAWAGLVVAEAMLLGDRPVSRIKIAGCMATQTFSVARTAALWSPTSISDTMEKYDAAYNLFRSETRKSAGVRIALEPIWSILTTLSGALLRQSDSRLLPLVEAIHLLHLARLHKDNQEAEAFLRPLAYLMPAELKADLERLSSLSPEDRVRTFDKVLSYLEKVPPTERERHIFAALAGYLATVAAGGAPSLALLSASAQRWPEITAWAYALGGVGEPVLWTSSFDGLGRLVARELLRPLRLDEPPTSDFALDEATILSDPQLADPLVHLRLKQSRIATVALHPGVNLSVPMNDQASSEGRDTPKQSSSVNRGASSASVQNPLALFAEAIWPYLEEKLAERGVVDAGSSKGRASRRGSNQGRLPLKPPPKY
ncbi:hypothetical protein [Bradyrhizobium sp. LA6.12]|uniref:hypothetical protein n=1 Tax=unclassified Bradyrhizobium TaxID=2631580 RepID=UPI00339B30A7